MAKNNTNAPQRNYELDFLKLVFALLVFWTHTNVFIGANTRISLPPQLGSVSVHFFFIASGLLMTNHIVKQGGIDENPGKSAVSYVLKKIKAINGNYMVSLFICLTVVTYLYIKEGHGVSESILYKLTRVFPEMFYLTSSGIWLNCSGVTWYLSAMFISMIPIAWLMYKNKDLTMYVVAPLLAILILGYMCKSNNWNFVYSDFQGFISGRLFTSTCGLCFGVCAYLIYSKIKELDNNKNVRIFMTCIMLLLYLVFFIAWFVVRSNTSVMSVVLILPITIGITFSGKSYTTDLFKHKWMRFFAPLSLSIYLNHWPARLIVQHLFSDKHGYKFCVSMMILFTALFCVMNKVIVTLCKTLCKNRLKKV